VHSVPADGISMSHRANGIHVVKSIELYRRPNTNSNIEGMRVYYTSGSKVMLPTLR
jgi:hypothetical protein